MKISQKQKLENANFFYEEYAFRTENKGCKPRRYDHLLAICKRLGLDFFIMQDFVVDQGGGCDCEFFMNYTNPSMRKLSRVLESALISDKEFRKNYSKYKKFNINWKDQCQTNIIINQFFTGLECDYPICCILDFCRRTNNEDDPEYFFEHEQDDLKSNKRFKNGPSHIRCVDCVIKELA